jgi:probable rRNA maturation factor
MSAKNKLALAIQYPDPRLEPIATRAKLRRWVQAALLGPAELTIRFVDADEGRALNRDYRAKDYATNVLTFAYNEGEELAEDEPVRADIILCTHLVVHGVLHAQGYDHEHDVEAAEMEQLERDILEALGYPDPYAGEHS